MCYAGPFKYDAMFQNIKTFPGYPLVITIESGEIVYVGHKDLYRNDSIIGKFTFASMFVKQHLPKVGFEGR